MARLNEPLGFGKKPSEEIKNACGEIKIEEGGRGTGRTTRLVSLAIQILFQHGSLRIPTVDEILQALGEGGMYNNTMFKYTHSPVLIDSDWETGGQKHFIDSVLELISKKSCVSCSVDGGEITLIRGLPTDRHSAYTPNIRLDYAIQFAIKYNMADEYQKLIGNYCTYAMRADKIIQNRVLWNEEDIRGRIKELEKRTLAPEECFKQPNKILISTIL